MNSIELKKEEAAFYFNQAILNILALDEVIEKQFEHIGGKRESAKKTIDTIFNNKIVLQNVENYVYNFKDVSKSARIEIEALLLKLVELRNYYSHYVHNDTVKILSNGEKPFLEKYYQIATEATGSEHVKLEIIENNRLTDAGVLFLLCMFLKKSQANKLIGSISGFKRTDTEGQPRRNLFTYYSVREGYKVVPDMQKHFLLFTLVNHLSEQDDHIEKHQPSDELGKGLFFHRIASTFLNVSGILNKMHFYTYQSSRLKEQRGELKPEKDTFTWIEPFQGNSYFSLNGHKGVISEDQLKDLCYTLLIEKQNVDSVEGKIIQFLKKFQNVSSAQQVDEDAMLEREYFPENYFERTEKGTLKEKILRRLDKRINPSSKVTGKAYDKMKEVMEFINMCLPSDEKLKRKDYRRYLKMVRFWSGEKHNIKREFDSKKWTRFLPRELWEKRNLEETYQFALRENKTKFEEMRNQVRRLKEDDLEKYQQINNVNDLEGLRLLARKYGVQWQEKDWTEYSGQIKKQISDNQKLTIMKQNITAELKKKHGIENLNLRISIDRNKSRQAVKNRIALPKGFVRNHIQQNPSEKISKKIRESACKILLSGKYKDLSKQFFEEKNFDKMTQINSLYEKNKLIALMVIYLMEQLGLELKEKTKLSELKQTRITYKISDKVTEDIPLSHYPSLVYAMNRKYVDNIDRYAFAAYEAQKAILDKVDIIEKQRMEFIKQVLGFEQYLFENKIIDKSKFTDVETHISFTQIHNELIQKGWDQEKVSKLKEARNDALHGQIPVGTSFDKAKLLIDELKK